MHRVAAIFESSYAADGGNQTDGSSFTSSSSDLRIPNRYFAFPGPNRASCNTSERFTEVPVTPKDM